MKFPYHPDYGYTHEYRARVLRAVQIVGVKIAAQYYRVGISTVYKWRRECE